MTKCCLYISQTCKWTTNFDIEKISSHKRWRTLKKLKNSVWNRNNIVSLFNLLLQLRNEWISLNDYYESLCFNGVESKWNISVLLITLGCKVSSKSLQLVDCLCCFWGDIFTFVRPFQFLAGLYKHSQSHFNGTLWKEGASAREDPFAFQWWFQEFEVSLFF